MKQLAISQDGQGPYDRWVRMPSHGREPNTGLSRAHIYQLIKNGKIKTASLRQPGKLTGVRVIWLRSLMSYIERYAVAETAETEDETAVPRDPRNQKKTEIA